MNLATNIHWGSMSRGWARGQSIIPGSPTQKHKMEQPEALINASGI